MNLANKITTFRIILIPIFVLFAIPIPDTILNKFELLSVIHQYSLLIATGIFIIASITDKLDGYIARKYNQVTNFGSLMDPLADKLMVASALIILVEQNKVASWIALIIIFREIAVTALRITSAFNHKVLAADKFGKVKLVCQVIAIPLCLLNSTLYFIRDLKLDSIMIFVTVVITVFSGINYFVKNKELFYVNGKLVV